MDLAGSGFRPMVSVYEHSNEPSVPTRRKFLYQLSAYETLGKKDAALKMYLVVYINQITL